MSFQPDLDGYIALPADAPFPAAFQGDWVFADTGLPGVTIAGREIVYGHPLPVHDLHLREDEGWFSVLNTLADTSALEPDWADRTVYLLALDPDGGLMIAGMGDPANLVRPEAIDPSTVRPLRSPYIALPDGSALPAQLQGCWRGAWHGQRVEIGENSVRVDDMDVPFIAAKLIDLIATDDGPRLSLVLEMAQAPSTQDALPALNFQLFAGDAMQAAGGPLRDTMFVREA